VTAGVLLVMALVAVGIGAVERQSVMPLLAAGLVGMAVTANQLITRQDGLRKGYPVAASTTLYEGTLVFLASGYADDDTASGANAFGGVAIAKIDNSAGSSGDLNVECHTEGVFRLVGSGFSQATVGSLIYATDNYTVTTTATGNSVLIGKCVGYVSSTVIDVKIDVSMTEGVATDSVTTQVLTFNGATGVSEIRVPDNVADALSIEISGGADFIVVDTTNSNEKLTILSAVTQKLGFYGTTPVVQPASADQADQGAMTTAGNNTGTSGAGLSLIGDTTMVNQASNLMNDLKALQEDIAALDTIVTAMRTALVNLGIIKGAA
jgi:hypothetical protein